MITLPANIETYLLESGFSSAEILVMKKLFDEGALSICELARKTGKGSNVLNKAVSKLARKRIISKDVINGTNRFYIKSLDIIIDNVRTEMKMRRDDLRRRESDIANFITSISYRNSRPQIEHFEGERNVMKAYCALLDSARECNELLHYYPLSRKEESDPMRDFLEIFACERKRRGVFSRVISHDTPLGRKFKERDAFLHRQTVLVPANMFIMAFEKIIAGDTIACMMPREHRASFIRYPQLAQVEKQMFENTWNAFAAIK